MPSALLSQQLSDDEQGRFADMIYERTGVRIPPQKKTLLTNRLRRLLKANGLERFEDYYRLLRSRPSDGPEWDAFLQEITTHETYLFRDTNQWDWFRDTYLPELKAAARRGERPKTLRVWSAACSTGDEVYTIACCVAEVIRGQNDWGVEILGSDIGVGALDAAREGTFSTRAMQNVSDSLRLRYFRRAGDDRWEAKPALKQLTRFRQHNLMRPLSGAPFDIVFVKNVLIYFDPESKRQVFRHVERSLKSGGMLVTGSAEGVVDLVRGYDRLQPWLHRKP